LKLAAFDYSYWRWATDPRTRLLIYLEPGL